MSTPSLPTLLLASLSPTERRTAEQTLTSLSSQEGFLGALLQLVLSSDAGALGMPPGQEGAVRLAGSVFFKNVVRRRWDDTDADTPLPPPEKAQLRSNLVPALLALSSPSDRAVRAQLAESIALIAAHDFPEPWGDLVDSLTTPLTPSLTLPAYTTNHTLLLTAHTIFARWRSEIRSDALFATINFVISRFVDPFLAVFRHTAGVLLDAASFAPGGPLADQNLAQTLAHTLSTLLDLFYDLACQDLPPALEDAQKEFWGTEGDVGWFLRLLAWDGGSMGGDPTDPSPSPPTLIKTRIFELAELYTHRYPELLAETNSVPALTQALWGVVKGAGGSGSGVAFDGLTAQALRFLSAAIRSGNYSATFSARQTIEGLVEGVVVPNVYVRESDIEQFTDDPLDYVRLDLSPFAGAGAGGGGMGGEGTTRRQAAADVLRALVGSGPQAEKDTTEVVGAYISRGLGAYAANGRSEWKAKDAAVYLLSAVAGRGGSVKHGITSTTSSIDVVQFFTDNILGDLQSPPATTDDVEHEGPGVHPMLQVDAVRYLCAFRGQLTKPQLLAVLPLLAAHLASANYVAYTWAAIAIERVLAMRDMSSGVGAGGGLMFGQADTRDAAPAMLDALLRKVEGAGTPEKMAENEYVMRCIMRIILTARSSLVPHYERILQRLVAILAALAKNPSNPLFDQYCWEGVAALVRFVTADAPQTLARFEEALFQPCIYILQQDIDQYVPYVCQLLAQLLELHTLHTRGSIPSGYKELLPLLLQPTSWTARGAVPGLVRQLRAFLRADGERMGREGLFVQVLAVVQQRLIVSKVNDVWGFGLLEGVVGCIDAAALQPYMKGVITMLLTRLQTGKTDQYQYAFVYFVMYVLALRPADAPEGAMNGGGAGAGGALGGGPGGRMTADFFIRAVEEVQPQLWNQLLVNVIAPQLPKLLPKDRKVAAVGLARLLARSEMMRAEGSGQAWQTAFTALARLFTEPQHLQSAQSTTAEDPDAALRALDADDVLAVNPALGSAATSTSGGAPVNTAMNSALAPGAGATYQVAYSRLAASEPPPEDPVAWAGDVKVFVGREVGGVLSGSGGADGGRVRSWVAEAAGREAVVAGFVEGLRGLGVGI